MTLLTCWKIPGKDLQPGLRLNVNSAPSRERFMRVTWNAMLDVDRGPFRSSSSPRIGIGVLTSETRGRNSSTMARLVVNFRTSVTNLAFRWRNLSDDQSKLVIDMRH